MPTYDYRCKKCHHKFEAFQSMTSDLLTTCPKCGKKSLERLIGAGAGIIFKGSGFYSTDYKRGSSSGPSARSSAAATSASGKSSSSSSDSSSSGSSSTSSSSGSSSSSSKSDD